MDKCGDNKGIWNIDIWDNIGDVYRDGNVCVPFVLLKLTVTNCSSHSTAANCEHKENKFDCSNNDDDDDEKDLLIMSRRTLLMGAKMWWCRAGNVFQNHHQQLVLNEVISWICCPFAKMGAAAIYQFPGLFLSLSDISLLLQDHRTRSLHNSMR